MSREERAEVIFSAIFDIMLIRWLMLGQWLVRPAIVCAAIAFVFFVAAYIEDGRWWPTPTDAQLLILTTFPAVSVPGMNWFAMRCIGRFHAVGFMWLHFMFGAGITLLLLALDVFLALGIGRNIVMTGNLLPKI